MPDALRQLILGIQESVVVKHDELSLRKERPIVLSSSFDERIPAQQRSDP